jgi:phosphate starvation-inducible PhoH-like protein
MSKLTDEQALILEKALDPNIQIVWIDAKAGTGKTWLAVLAAAKLYEKEKKELLYTFFPVQEDKLGFLPGNKDEKTDPYKQPLKDALNSLGYKPQTVIFDPAFPDNHPVNRTCWVRADSHVFMRGINLENKTIIIDEAQNGAAEETKKILTRIHDNCKVFVIGHHGQIDLPNPHLSGFEAYMHHFYNIPYSFKANLTINFRGKLAQHADELR